MKVHTWPWPWLAVVVGLLLVGCAGTTTQDSAVVDEPGRTLVYDCDQVEFVVSQRGEVATLYLRERAFELARVVSASGEKYAAGDVEFWSKGETARLQAGVNTYTNCRLDRARAPWEEARRRGVEFRGVGQEPGWLVEITPGGQILLVTGYGQQRWLFETPDPEQSAEATVYQTSEGGHALKITLTVEFCQDTMSGAVFKNVVTVDLDQRRLQGCGSALEPDWYWQ